MHVQPYLYFGGRTEEALEFYKQAIGAQVEFMMRFSESPEPCDPAMVSPGSEHKIMHASFRVGDAMLMASDGDMQQEAKFQGISLALSCPDVATAERTFDALASGGQVQMPLVETFFSPKFGMLADKFGVSWMVLVEQGK